MVHLRALHPVQPCKFAAVTLPRVCGCWHSLWVPLLPAHDRVCALHKGFVSVALSSSALLVLLFMLTFVL
jgi:hypothetical protein